MNTIAFTIELKLFPGSGLSNRDEEQLIRSRIGRDIYTALAGLEGLNIASPGSGDHLPLTQNTNDYSLASKTIATTPELGQQPPLATISGFVSVSDGTTTDDSISDRPVPVTETAVLCDGRYVTGPRPDIQRFLPPSHSAAEIPASVYRILERLRDLVDGALENIEYKWWSVNLLGHRFGHGGMHLPSEFN